MARRWRQVDPIRWSAQQLDADRRLGIEAFRKERLDEPTEEFSARFAEAQRVMGGLLAMTLDLTDVQTNALAMLTRPTWRDAFRYLAGPPISIDDLKTIVDTNSVSPRTLKENPRLVQRIIETVFAGLDRGRFPWIFEGRGPDPAERNAAILASAILLASQQVATSRRTQGKKAQEDRVRQQLLALGFTEIRIAGGVARTIRDAPMPGQFCRETTLASRKADLIVGLWDGRIMPIECKVSNSSLNSVKRLNNDAAVKAEVWSTDLGSNNVVPVAVLSGVYGLQRLEEAQARGLTLYWANRLSDLSDWIEHTRPEYPTR
ncbi:MAG: XamI family restriction endonuclease [Chloroflexota bacterium]|nr:XamI family restriction endonuclease [Chloroflexota bacterium]